MAAEQPHLQSWSQARGRASAPARPRPEWNPHWPECPPLTDAERELVHKHLDAFATEHETRVDEHVRRLERVARSLGRRVGRGDCTVESATRRLDGLVEATDPECVIPIALVPYAMAQEIIGAAFAAGVKAGRRAGQH